METLLRIGTAGLRLDFGVATTKAERAAVLTQRFRVYPRRGYYRVGRRWIVTDQQHDLLLAARASPAASRPSSSRLLFALRGVGLT